VTDHHKTTLVDEDDCPKDAVCSYISESRVIGKGWCLKRCKPSPSSNPCPVGSETVCHPISEWNTMRGITVCWFHGCNSDKECPVTVGGQCTTDQPCAAARKGAFCSKGACALPGNCTTAGICGPHKHGSPAAKVGAPCASDLQCPGNGSCLKSISTPSDNGYPNGYCAVRNCTYSKQLPQYACPKGSTCTHLYYGGICFKTCKLDEAKTCRGHAKDRGGDYECQAWNNRTVWWRDSAEPFSKEPVCVSAAICPCDYLKSTGSCSSLGLKGGTRPT